MRRRDFIKVAAGSAVTWPRAARAQRPTMPMIGFIRDGSAESNARWLAGFHKGLSETGYVEGQNVTVEYHWLEGKYDRVPELVADLVRRHVTAIASLGTSPAQARGVSSSPATIRLGHWPRFADRRPLGREQ